MNSTLETRPTSRTDDPLEGTEALHVDISDVQMSLITLGPSLAALWLSISGSVSALLILLLHLGVVCIPAGFLLQRHRHSGELTIPVLLLITTLAGGPLGAAGTAIAAWALWYQRPTSVRLLDWYGYIVGIVDRTAGARLYDDVIADRLPPDRAASVPRFNPILAGSSVDEQQRVLGVIGRRYHSDFRLILRQALRHRNGLVRTQAAAIASRLDLAEKSRLWGQDSVAESVPTEANPNLP